MRILLGLLLTAGSAAFGQCVFSLSPTSASFNSAGGNDTVAITVVSGSGTCSRTATSSASWITISFGTPGTNNGSVGYTVQSNPFTVDRSGTMTIAGQTFTVTQSAGSCTYSLSSSSANVPAAGGNGSFNLTASSNSCPWTASSSTSDWLTITTGGSGSGSATIRYTASANTTTTSRSATISIGGQTYTVTQPGVCGFTLNPVSTTVTAAGGTGSITVAATANNCAWTATSGNPDWLTLTGSTSGTGSGTVTYSAAGNTSLIDRSGTITIGGVAFSILQTSLGCSFNLSNSVGNFTAAGGSGSFYVTSSCPWTPASTADWIVLTSGASTTGTGTVSFSVAGNTTTQLRTASITLGNTAFTVRQTGVTCAVTIGTVTGTAPASGGVGGFAVNAADGCAWTASTTSAWITLAGASGSGAGNITYTAAPNTTAQGRSAIITIANQQFTLTQDGAQCDYQLSPGQASIPDTGGTGSIHITTACSWSASSAANWIAFPGGATGTGTADLAFSVAANSSSDARTGIIKVGTQSFTVVQSGHSCSFTVSPGALTIAGRGGKATAQVTGAKGCKWEPSKDQDWLSIDAWSSIDGSGSVTVSAPANPLPVVRVATLSAGGQAVVVTQGGMEVLISSTASVLNAASFAAGPVAAGELVTIFGSNLGPKGGVSWQLTGDGQHIATTIGSVQVLFDGVAAPLLFASDQQVSVQVPYAVAVSGKATTELKVVNQGVESNPLTLQVGASSPAIFTMDASGKGQGAVLNQDGTVNSAKNAAARNTILQIFATGEGQTRPPGEDGKIANGTTLPAPLGTVTVLIGGQSATVTYAGAAPGAIAGLFQVNARIPANVAVENAVPVVVRVGSASSPGGVTVAVK